MRVSQFGNFTYIISFSLFSLCSFPGTPVSLMLDIPDLSSLIFTIYFPIHFLRDFLNFIF